jgi:Arc/MetJ family transcription regulator
VSLLPTVWVGIPNVIDVNDELLRQAVSCCGATTETEAIERALRLLIQLHSQASIRELRGKISWEGDLDLSR